jgi:hypothetical protein
MRRLKLFIEVPYASFHNIEEIVEIEDDEDVDKAGKACLETLYSSSFPGGWYLVDEDGNEIEEES